MIRIYYIDKDTNFYKDLKCWLPSDCTIIQVTFDKIESYITKKSSNRDIFMINPEYTGNNYGYLEKLIKKINPTPVIMISETISLQQVVSTVKMGAHSYLDKQKEKSLIIDSIKNIIYGDPVEPSCLEDDSLSEMIGDSESMITLKRQIQQLSSSSLNIHLSGPSGTGKEVLAKAIHCSSSRKEKQMVSVNCGAISETIMESELFGSIEGAFTDARNRIGYFEKAHKSTIFLDEICELNPSGQVKLLRVLENGCFMPIGSNVEKQSDFRLITATNKNIKEEMIKGNFREDLYYRITSLIIPIPPLKERIEDIPQLSEHFLKQAKSPKKLKAQSLAKLMAYNWPGNIRELKQTILRADFLSGSSLHIEPQHLINY